MPVPARGNQTSGGRWVRPTEKKAGGDVTVANRTTTYTSPAFNIEDAFELDAQLAITAISGTGASAQLGLQTSQDGTTWISRPENANIPAQTAIGAQNVSFMAPGTQARWTVTIAGTTPNISFAIDHQAVVGAV